jgi:hypothetical protein
MPNDAIVPYQEEPNHMIIWLDLGIGDPDNYQHLKHAFSSTADPKNDTPVKLVDRDYDELLRTAGPRSVNFEGVWFLLAAFTNVEHCIECFERNKDKRIFFITSGSIGQEAVPKILAKYKQTFTDQVTDKAYASIYVFCHSVEFQMAWALDYREYIQIFTFDKDLLVRMIRDIGDDFLTESKRLLDEDPPNTAAAYHRLSWAHELYQRYRDMEKVSMKKEFDEVNELLEGVEEELKASSDDGNE